MSLLSVPFRADVGSANWFCSYRSKEWLQPVLRIVLPSSNCLRKTEHEWAPVFCAASTRPTLDDVERLTRGRASKSKIGSRAIPHRLNADERKAYELAKKRGFVVHQPNTRRYPLINSHRNYCDAVGIPCIRIHQGIGGQADEVVMDLTPLRLSKVDLQSFKQVVIIAVGTTLSQNNQGSDPSVVEEGIQQKTDTKDSLDVTSLETGDGPINLMDVDPSISTEETLGDSEPLRFLASSRSEAKLIAQTGVGTWKRWSISNLKVLA